MQMPMNNMQMQYQQIPINNMPIQVPYNNMPIVYQVSFIFVWVEFC